MPMGGCGGAHIGSLCISVIILVIVIILIVMVVYNYNSTNNTTTQQMPQINNRVAALAAAGMYNRNNKNGFATSKCSKNSTVGCFYARGTLPSALKNIISKNNGYIPMSIVNSLKKIRTAKGGGLSAKAMQASHWPPMTAKGLPANGSVWKVTNHCSTGPCYATSKCNNSTVACFYAGKALPTELKNFEAAHNGMITRKLANSLQNIRTAKGGGLSPNQMQKSRWSASA